MKFAHIADCHLGGWREERMRRANELSFKKAIEMCAEQNIDFLLISGDLFNTALPSIDCIKLAVEQLKNLKEKHINIYAIPGSHDYSASGKTMLDVLEIAGIITIVSKGAVENEKLKLKFFKDEKTGALITGMVGKKLGLEKEYYKQLDFEHLEKQKGFKIFMFHTALEELKPLDLKDMDAMPVSLLPREFNYYAGGHVHVADNKSLPGYSFIIYPGPVFPNNFAELEKLRSGYFCMYDNGKIEHLPIPTNPVACIKLNCEQKTADEIENELLRINNVENAIVALRLEGMMKFGRPADINFRKVFDETYKKGAYFVMKNTAKLESRELEEIQVEQGSVEETEENIINEHTGQLKLYGKDREIAMAKELMNILSQEKDEAEPAVNFERRIILDSQKIIDGL